MLLALSIKTNVKITAIVRQIQIIRNSSSSLPCAPPRQKATKKMIIPPLKYGHKYQLMKDVISSVEAC